MGISLKLPSLLMLAEKVFMFLDSEVVKEPSLWSSAPKLRVLGTFDVLLPKPSFFCAMLSEKLPARGVNVGLSTRSTRGVYTAELSARRSFSNAERPGAFEETTFHGLPLLKCMPPKFGGLRSLPRGEESIVPGVFGEEVTTPSEGAR